MRLSLVCGVIGHLLRLFSLAFLPPIALAMVDGEYWDAEYFAIALAASAAAGWFFGRWWPKEPTLRRAEALAIVAGTWLVIGHFGAIPYVFMGIPPVDAIFESISGFTTTGATILTDFDSHSRAFFLWRAMTQWFGGLGVIALFVVVLPRLGIAGRQLFFAEASISTGEGISPQVRGAARKLWLLYCGLTALVTVLLLWTGYPVFDAIVHALTTMSAGGFSPHARSIEGYANPQAEWILIGFMVLAGTSFPLLWRALSGRPLALFRDGEFIAYVGVMMVGSFLLAALLTGGLPDLNDLRVGAFQVASVTSSTGYASVDFNEWEDAAKAVLLVMMLIGGCAGSACGGPKVIRYLLLLKFLRREMTQVMHPQAVIPLRYRNRQISSPIIRAVITLIFLYVAGYFVVGVIVAMLEPRIDLTTAMSASLACFGNIGPAFGVAGPMGSYAGFSDPTKVLLTLAMWLGRLEIVTIFALLHRDAWRNMSWKGPEPKKI